MPRHEIGPLRSLRAHSNLRQDTCRRVPSAEVVVANYTLLQADFPHLREECLLEQHRPLRSMSRVKRQRAVRELLDSWLLDHAALLTDAQAADNRANARIPT